MKGERQREQAAAVESERQRTGLEGETDEAEEEEVESARVKDEEAATEAEVRVD